MECQGFGGWEDERLYKHFEKKNKKKILKDDFDAFATLILRRCSCRLSSPMFELDFGRARSVSLAKCDFFIIGATDLFAGLTLSSFGGRLSGTGCALLIIDHLNKKFLERGGFYESKKKPNQHLLSIRRDLQRRDRRLSALIERGVTEAALCAVPPVRSSPATPQRLCKSALLAHLED